VTVTSGGQGNASDIHQPGPQTAVVRAAETVTAILGASVPMRLLSVK